MNKQIDQISDQVMYEFRDAFDSGEYIPDEFFERFAELIVRECCNIVSDEVECVYHFDNQHPVVARLKEHFGVE